MNRPPLRIQRKHLLNRSGVEYTDYEKGWIEALIDGEGSLSLLKASRPLFRDGCTMAPRLSISNTCRELLERAMLIIGAGHISVKKAKNEKASVLYQFECSSGTLRNLLPKIKLIAKEKQRQLLLEALGILQHRTYNIQGDCGSKRLREIYTEIRRLNSWRGNKVVTAERT